MNFEIAIHERKGSFSDRWIEYCTENKLPFDRVNCFDNDIIAKLARFDVLLWHWAFYITGDVLLARSLIQTVESMGKVVFPNAGTCWHYDNKIAQKYLLESVGAPLVPTYIFYRQEDALKWIETASFPKVFKLSGGAGSTNVKLVRVRNEARILARRAFKKGFKQSGGYFYDSKRKINRLKQRKDYLGTLFRLPKAFIKQQKKLNLYPIEKSYIYFQDFMPNNQFDTRVTIIGNRAFSFTRNVRKNDFRASGSGDINYRQSRINSECINIAFDTAKRIASQSMAFDLVIDSYGKPMITEVSYVYDPSAVFKCPGHWDNHLNWHAGAMWPQDAILEDIINRLEPFK